MYIYIYLIQFSVLSRLPPTPMVWSLPPRPPESTRMATEGFSCQPARHQPASHDNTAKSMPKVIPKGGPKGNQKRYQIV